MNAKILVLVICVDAITYLLLYNLHDCFFNVLGFNFFCNSPDVGISLVVNDWINYSVLSISGKLCFIYLPMKVCYDIF